MSGTGATSYLEGGQDGLRQEMRRDPDVLLMGEDIAGDFGGGFQRSPRV